MVQKQLSLTCLIAILTWWVPCGHCIAKEPLRVRVLSYNIHHGEGTDGKFDLDRIAKVIRSAEPDLVALQEVDRKTKRASGVDQPAELARLTGMTSYFQRNIEYDGGEYGNAILARWTIRQRANHALPSHYQGEQRGALEIEVESVEGRTLRFFATHLDYRPADGERRASVEAIEKLIVGRESTPTILAGDLNAVPDSAVLEAFRRTWQVPTAATSAFTFPAEKPIRQIDYVIARPAESWKLLEIRVIDEPIASDHRPLLTVFELP